MAYPAAGAPVLVARDLTKQYGSFIALNNVSLELHRSEVIAVMGENGAGKSTLMKLIAGIESATAGEIELPDLADRDHRQTAERQDYVAIVPQEIDLAEERSVGENIYMGIEPGNRWFPSSKQINQHAKQLLESIGSDLDPHLRCGDLDAASKQMVLIARALARASEVIIFDEPTANLSPIESEALFSVIENLKSEGKGILYVSHRIPEVFRLSDRIEVLRDGSHVASWPTTETNPGSVVNAMVGRELELTEELNMPFSGSEPALDVRGLKAEEFGPLDFQLLPGEVLGIAGLPDSGRDELLQTIYGAIKPSAGQLFVWGKEYESPTVRKSVEHGIVYLPGERRAAGIFPTMTVKENIAPLIAPQHTTLGIINHRALTRKATEFAQKVNVRAASFDLSITQLSGGNQQKALIARLLATNPRVMLLDEPTRGVDVGAKAEIYELIRSLTLTGLSAVISSSDLPELLGQCHRIAVMFRGSIAAILEGPSTSEEEIMAYATLGHSIEEIK